MSVNDREMNEAASAGRETSAGVSRYSVSQLERARELLGRLHAVRRTARFYPRVHPAVREAVAALARAAGEYHAEGVDVDLTFFEGEVLLGEQLLAEESIVFDQLIRDMMGLGIGSLRIGRGAETEEYERLVELLAFDSGASAEGRGLREVTEDLTGSHIEVGGVRVVDRAVQEERSEESPSAAYSSAVAFLAEVALLLRSDRAIPASKVNVVAGSLLDNVLSNRDAMLQLSGLKNYDEYTYYHSTNVAILSLALGSSISSDQRFLSSLGVGALLHDIGKLSVDHEVLNKPGTLTPEEWAEMKCHPELGGQLVTLMPGVDRSALVTIVEHHMRYDLTGYPERTPKRRQHLVSRIVAVADSYDAMTSRRCYSAARVPDEAMAMLVRAAGTSLDPALVRLFVRVLGVYPPRSAVRMSDGSIGVVLRANEGDPSRPVVRIIAEPGGAFIEPRDVDLIEDTSLGVERCIDPRLLNVDVGDYLTTR